MASLGKSSGNAGRNATSATARWSRYKNAILTTLMSSRVAAMSERGMARDSSLSLRQPPKLSGPIG